jgi:hypothetical protein
MSFISIFKNHTGIEKKIDSFLDLASQSGLIFTQGMDAYLDDRTDVFEHHLAYMVETEKEADTLRRAIEDLLYRKTLVPESRGDVLELIERMDALLGQFKGVMFRIEIERPQIPSAYRTKLKTLNNCAVQTVESMVLSLRAYFKDISQVAAHMHKVTFWETESDKEATRLQREIFRSDQHSLAEKMQLRGIIKHTDNIADQAEDLADKLAIFVLKRSL